MTTTTQTPKDETMKYRPQAIADAINNAGLDYFGDKAKPWTCEHHSRIYFGREYVTVEHDGEVHARKAGKARAATIGASAVEMVEDAIASLS